MKLQQIAKQLECELIGNGELEIDGVAGIEEARAGQVTFVSNPKYAAKARSTAASAVIVSKDFPAVAAATLRTSNPYLAFARAIELFYQTPIQRPGIDPSARIASTATIGEGASIGPFVVIEDDVAIGRGATIYPFVHIGR